LLESGGTLARGNGGGTITTGAAVWNGGGQVQLNLANAAGTAAGSDWDTWKIAGSLSLTGTTAAPCMIDLAGSAAGFDSTSLHSWLIATATGGINGFNSADFLVDPPDGLSLGGGLFGVAETGDSLYLDFTPDPPPSGSALPSASPLAAASAGTSLALHTSAVPEPSTLLLLFFAAAAGLLLAARRSREP
jgi:hypothetical protein